MPGYRKSKRVRNPLPYFSQYYQQRVNCFPSFSAPCLRGMYPVMCYTGVNNNLGMGVIFPPATLTMPYYQQLTVNAGQGLVPLNFQPYQSIAATPSEKDLDESTQPDTDGEPTQPDVNELPQSDTENEYTEPNVVDECSQSAYDDEVTRSDDSDSDECSHTDNNGNESTNSSSDKTTCVICLESPTNPRKCDTCVAVCCYICIDEWLKLSGTCPMCCLDWDVIIVPSS